jgi:hypothetical protein
MVAICEELLQESQLDLAIRVGDCLAMLVEYFHSIGNMKKSYQYLCSMKERRILLHPYIDAEVLDDVSRAVGKRLDDHEEDIQDEELLEGEGEGDGDFPRHTEEKNEYYGRKPQQQQQQRGQGGQGRRHDDEDDDEVVDEEELAEVPWLAPSSSHSSPVSSLPPSLPPSGLLGTR